MKATHDTITELRVEGMRSLANIRLPLGGLTVLIGDNGSGKSSLLEAIEILRKASNPGDFLRHQVEPFHGPLSAMLRIGAPMLRIGARIEGAGPRLDYSFALTRQGNATVIAEECLDAWVDLTAREPLHVIERDRAQCSVLDVSKGEPLAMTPSGPSELVLTRFGAFAQPAIRRVLDVLDKSRVHVPFDVLPTWVATEQQRRPPLREPAQVGQTSEVQRLGSNLANCYFALSQEHPPEVWQRTLERVRAGLGPDVTDIRTPSAGRGQIELVVYFRGIAQPIPAISLSDGQLAYLGFVALTELGKSHTLVAFDEPESHFHPQLVTRVTWLLEELAQSCPVVISTHSDRLLDSLSDPANSAVLCELDANRATRLLRPNRQVLTQWLERYRGLGELRAEGYDRHALTESVEDNP